MSQVSYVFDQVRRNAELERLRLIEAIFDEGTQRVLLAACLRRGSWCLEIGAGAGSIAAWMGETVGPSGRVTAVDINTQFLSTLKRANIEVRQEDIRSASLQPGSFDLAHARFVFIHIAEWRTAIEATLRLLKPGGRLVLEEPDFSISRALSGPPELCQSFERVHRAIEAMFAERGMDYAFGSRLPSILQEYGLADISFENDVPVAQGGSSMAKMMALSTAQLREKYVATGLATDEDIDRYDAFARDSGCSAIFHGIVRSTGSKT